MPLFNSPLSFEERMKQLAQGAQEQAQRLAPGPERDALLEKARQLDIACHINDWLSSPGLQPPR